MLFKMKEEIVVYGDMLCFPLFISLIIYFSITKTEKIVVYWFLIVALIIDGFFVFCYFTENVRSFLFGNLNSYYKTIHIVDMLAIPCFIYLLSTFRESALIYTIFMLPFLAVCVFTYLFINDLFEQ